MSFKKKKIALLSIFLGLMLAGESEAKDHFIIAPECLIQNTVTHYKMLSAKTNYSLIKVDDNGLDQLIAGKIHQKKLCGGFINVTDFTVEHAKTLLAEYSAKAQHQTHEVYTIAHSKEVNQLLEQINPQEMWQDLTVFSSFNDRYSNSDLGVSAALWIKTTLLEMTTRYGRDDVTVYLVNTGKHYKQPSVVMKIGSSEAPAVVVGAHIDTLSSSDGIKPGADDDGSGTVTALAVARTLLASSIRFNKPIYIIWYSAEEMGLVGSQHVVANFKQKKIPVANVIHFDMTGYAYQNDPTMWLLTDYTNENLTAYLASLIKTYVKKPVGYTQCGYACSDHATWTMNGYNAAIAFEAKFGNDDPYIHTSEDTMAILSLEHMTDYAKLGVAFVGELAEPQA